MAKSAGFFTLRRGSTKSLTFQVLDGKQITKDRVTVVRNPKTSRQAEQRAKLLPAQRFMTMLRSIVDHSWENVAYGQKSLQHFMSKAMRIQPENPMVKGEIGWYPQSYPISEGSLPSMRAYLNGGEDTYMQVPGLQGADTFNELITIGVLQEGDQLTAIGVCQIGESFVVRIDRAIVNAENVTEASSGATLKTQNELFEFKFGTTPNCGLISGDEMCACAVILSRRTASKWLRSSETMAAYNVNSVLWSTAVASYMNAASELTSPWYLNAADNDVISEIDLNSGEWSPFLLARSASPGSDTTIYLGAKNNLYGNYALVTADGKATGEVYGAQVSSGTTLAQLQLSNFAKITDSQGGTLDDADQRYAGAFGSTTLTAIAAEQPDQFLAASVIGK